MGIEQSTALWEQLRAAGHIDVKGKVQDSLKKALKEGTLAVPESFSPQLQQITQVLRKLAGRLEVKNADERRQVRPRQAVLQSQDFSSPLGQEQYVSALIAANEKLLSDAARARDVAGKAGDAESQDLMVGRITLHQKTVWMLKSFLKG